MTDTRVIRAILYLRISDLRETDLKDYKDIDSLSEAIEKFFADRERQLREFAKQLSNDQVRWEVVGVIRENDVIRRQSKNGKIIRASAFKKNWKVTQPDGTTIERVWRPGFQLLLSKFRDGSADGVLCENLNRVLRDQYDGLDLRSVALKYNVNARSIAGTITLTDGGTRGERTTLGILTEIAADFSENMTFQVSQGRARKAMNGEFGGGRRPFGFEADGVTPVKREYAAIREWSHRVLRDTMLRRSVQQKSENSLARIAADMNAGDIPTVTGTSWQSTTIKDILLRPRNAGIMVYQGKEIGEAPWEPIISEAEYRAVFEVLTDKHRNPNPGAGRLPVWQGSGVYLCGNCDDGTTVNVAIGGRDPRYRCKARNHLARDVAYTDKVVDDWIEWRLSKPDVLHMFRVATAKPDVDMKALHEEKLALAENLKTMAIDRVKGVIQDFEYYAAREYATSRLIEIEELLADAIDVQDPLYDIAKSPNIRQTWINSPLAVRQGIIRRLATVRIMPGRKGAKFDAHRIVIEPIEWKAKAA